MSSLAGVLLHSRLFIDVGASQCVFAFPHRALLPAFVAKARAEGLRGIVIVPFTPSDPAWPALAFVSLTVIVGHQKDRCLILPNSAQFPWPVT
jgi:hypothetical protein